MKNKIKLIISFLIGVILGGTTLVFGAELLPGINVSFDNSKTSLKSVNVQDALDELYGNSVTAIDSIYDAIVAKGVTPESKTINDMVSSINNMSDGKFNGTIRVIGELSSSGTGYFWYSSNPPSASTSNSSVVTIDILVENGEYSSYTISGNSNSNYTEGGRREVPAGSFVPAVNAGASFSITSIKIIPK